MVAALIFSSQLALAQFSQQGQKLVGTGASGQQTDQGYSVALSADGSTAIVGGPADGSDIGAVWIYTRSNGLWVQQGGKLIGSGAVGMAAQGVSVALSGDGNTAIVGGDGDASPSGAAWVFVGPTLQVTPTTNIAAAGNQGGPFAPSSFQYQLSATVGTISYSISGVPNWLTASSTSGTASTGTTVTFTVNANANSLAVGTYGPTTITFTNTDTAQGTQTLTATLHRQSTTAASYTHHQYCRFGDTGRPVLTVIFQLHPQRHKRQRQLFNIQRAKLAYVFFNLGHRVFFGNDRDVHGECKCK
jgi:hypothetical protein